MARLAKAPTNVAASTDSATSASARALRDFLATTSSSPSVRADPLADAKTEVLRIAETCSSPNWDGYGANPVAPQAVMEALFVLDTLPSETTTPDVVPEPTGGLGFEWENDRGASLIVSVSGNRMVAYAASLGDGGRRRGNERFINFLPAPVLELLKNEFREREF